MTEFENHQEYTQYTHNAFYKIVIRHAAIDAALRFDKATGKIEFEFAKKKK